jgi:hypothetical protein
MEYLEKQAQVTGRGGEPLEPIKIVVRFLDGSTVKGYTQNFFPNKPLFHLTLQEGAGPKESVEIPMDRLKAVFFVRDFTGDKNFEERKGPAQGEKIPGRLIEVTCKDGEVIVGTTTGYDPRRAGFFLFPVDGKSNNMKAFILTKAVERARFL